MRALKGGGEKIRIRIWRGGAENSKFFRLISQHDAFGIPDCQKEKFFVKRFPMTFREYVTHFARFYRQGLPANAFSTYVEQIRNYLEEMNDVDLRAKAEQDLERIVKHNFYCKPEDLMSRDMVADEILVFARTLR